MDFIGSIIFGIFVIRLGDSFKAESEEKRSVAAVAAHHAAGAGWLGWAAVSRLYHRVVAPLPLVIPNNTLPLQPTSPAQPAA